MIHEAIQHRSGRAIAMARFVLATVFLVAIWADPSQPSRYPREAYLILAGYALLSGVYLVATWDNWWLEYQGSRIAHLVDIALFALMVFLTDGYTSPFFTFFVFIILSALIKWGWRETKAGSGVGGSPDPVRYFTAALRMPATRSAAGAMAGRTRSGLSR